ncbi:hypothetical protein GJ688_09090 [Heliobacillus mobilis]|uniref:Uncharacterized protein n=1 Tax=Heliobacterium mobile TaxID=28064 RepID=A0A6I3SJP5_HELMO|nr:hypothetical protein [Heliobacterium mobile]MTV49134.1 hypothetical protein [Heliobacterium mobile]
MDWKEQLVKKHNGFQEEQNNIENAVRDLINELKEEDISLTAIPSGDYWTFQIKHAKVSISMKEIREERKSNVSLKDVIGKMITEKIKFINL